MQHGIDRAVIADDQNGFLVEVFAEIGGDAVNQILRQAHEAQEDAVLIDVGAVFMATPEVYTDGCGFCGKGHKEWVKVSEGGPYLKARGRLG